MGRGNAGKTEISINMNKLLRIKPLVDDKTLEIQDACKILGISRHLYGKFSREIDAMNSTASNKE